MTEDDKALVERLRQQGNWYVDNAYNLPLRAADRIEQLTAEIERLRGLLNEWTELAREHLDTELAGRTFAALERTRK